MITILGAGGAIGSELARQLLARTEPLRLVSRNPKPFPGAETMAADLTDPASTAAAVAGSRIVFLLAGLKYDLDTWRKQWPPVMRNTIEACKKANARLVFFDNVYMYGKVDGAMTEQTPFRPSSRKGEVRAEIATMLLREITAGSLTAMIARAPDFYGPNVRTSMPNLLIFDKLSKGKRAMCLASDSTRHSYAYTPDCAQALMMLSESDSAWNQTWHVPTAPNPPTGKQFIEMAARALDVAPKYFVLNRLLLAMAGWFDRTIAELREMLYQNEFDYLFDSTKFVNAFGAQPTSYPEGIRQSVHAQAANGNPAAD